MPRVELLDSTTAPLPVQQYFADGDPGPIVAALANVPELVGPTLGFVGQALSPGAAGIRWTEFAIVRTSALQGCEFCVRSHSAVSLDAGLSVDEIKALRGELEIADVFDDPAEVALLNWIDAMGGATGPVPQAVHDAVRTHVAEHLLVQLSTTIGATMYLNRFATGFELPTAPEVMDKLVAAGIEPSPAADLESTPTGQLHAEPSEVPA